MQTKLEVEIWPVARLRPSARNPRRHSAEQIGQIGASIAAFDVCRPVLVRPDGEIIAGEAVWRAIMAAGRAECPVIVLAHLSAAQADALRIADNRLALSASWDDAMLADLLDELAAIEIDLPVLGFSDAELAKLLPGIEHAAAALPALPSDERAPFQQLTFTLHDSQVGPVREALKRAKAAGDFAGPNGNSNGNALARIAEHYLARP